MTGRGDAYLLPNEFVLGDQQVTFKKIKDDLFDAGGINETTAVYSLLFIPQPVDASKNVYYKICVEYKNAGGATIIYCGGAAETNSQPSPPADAK